MYKQKKLVFVKNGAIDERETEMMSVRWKVFYFNRQIPQTEQKEVSPCPACFARLILHWGPLETYLWMCNNTHND